MEYEHKIAFLEKKAKRFSLQILEKAINEEIDADFSELPRKVYEMGQHIQALQEDNERLEQNFEIVCEKNIELKIDLDRKIQKNNEKKNLILLRQEMLNSKIRQFEQMRQDVGADQSDVSEEVDEFDEPYYASRKKIRKMKKNIE